MTSNDIVVSWGNVTTAGGETYKDAIFSGGVATAWDWKEDGIRHDPGYTIAALEKHLTKATTHVVLSRGSL